MKHLSKGFLRAAKGLIRGACGHERKHVSLDARRQRQSGPADFAEKFFHFSSLIFFRQAMRCSEGVMLRAAEAIEAASLFLRGTPSRANAAAHAAGGDAA